MVFVESFLFLLGLFFAMECYDEFLLLLLYRLYYDYVIVLLIFSRYVIWYQLAVAVSEVGYRKEN